jgi:3-hydroxyisobutyrate dehydrogenase
VCDVRSEATGPFAAGSRIAATPAELAAHCTTVIVAVVDDAQVRAVVAGPDGALAGAAPDCSVVIVSTISVATVTGLAAEASGHGVVVVDCGVSGGPGAAADGQLVCMVGGDAAAVESVRPVLEVIGSLVLHMGPLGAGLSAKLARNVVQYGSWLAAYEAQVLAEAAGIDLVKLGRAIKASDARIGGASTLMFRDTVAPWPPDTDAGLLGAMAAAASLAHKDLGAARRLADDLGVAMPLASLTDEYCDRIFGLSPSTARPDGGDGDGAAGSNP